MAEHYNTKNGLLIDLCTYVHTFVLHYQFAKWTDDIVSTAHTYVFENWTPTTHVNMSFDLASYFFHTYYRYGTGIKHSDFYRCGFVI